MVSLLMKHAWQHWANDIVRCYKTRTILTSSWRACKYSLDRCKCCTGMQHGPCGIISRMHSLNAAKNTDAVTCIMASKVRKSLKQQFIQIWTRKTQIANCYYFCKVVCNKKCNLKSVPEGHSSLTNYLPFGIEDIQQRFHPKFKGSSTFPLRSAVKYAVK